MRVPLPDAGYLATLAVEEGAGGMGKRKRKRWLDVPSKPRVRSTNFHSDTRIRRAPAIGWEWAITSFALPLVSACRGFLGCVWVC